MDNTTSPIEPLPGFLPYPQADADTAWRESPRARLFALTFITTLALGVGWTLLQPVVYRSSATVLMSPPSAIDASAEKADIQSVAIQSRILLGTEVTQQLRSALDDTPLTEAGMPDLRKTLRVEAVPKTNLVEMIAEGTDAGALPTLVNTWIDVYIDIRAQEIRHTQEQTLEVVQDQLSGMARKLDQARAALATYRNENHITSVKQQQNDALARLEGLNKSLNTAVEKEVAARANLESLRSAIAAGKNVVPPDERESVDNMQKELFSLQSQLAKLGKTYTENYIRYQPGVREIPARIAELQAALATQRTQGQGLVLATAEQEHAAALQAVEGLQQKLRNQEQAAAQFTTIYAKHQALADDLAELETVNRQTQSRLLQVQVNQVEKYPQVSVIDRPDTQSERVGPDYPLLLGASIAAALGIGVLSVWLYGFLGPRPAKPAFVTLSGVHMYPQDMQHQLTHARSDAARLGQQSTHRLSHTGAEDPPADSEQPPPDQDNTPERVHRANATERQEHPPEEYRMPAMNTVKKIALVLVAGLLLLLVALDIWGALTLGAIRPATNPPVDDNANKVVMVFGATGSVGDGLLKAAVEDSEVTKVYVVARRSSPRIDAGVAAGKIDMRLHEDFTDYSDLADILGEVNTVLWGLGTTSVGMDDDTYTRIHVDFPVAFVTAWLAAHRSGPMAFHYVTGMGTDSNGEQHWAREKGRAEREVAALAAGSGLRTFGYRSAFIRPSSEQANVLHYFLEILLRPGSLVISAEELGDAMLEISARTTELANGTTIDNADSIAFAQAYRERQRH